MGFLGDVADKLFAERAMTRDVHHSGENFKALVEEEAIPTKTGEKPPPAPSARQRPNEGVA